MRQVRARFVIGLTATPTRKDGHHPIMYMQCGPARFTMSARAMTDPTPFEHAVIPRITHFRMMDDSSSSTIQDAYAALVADSDRDDLIAQGLIHAIRRGRSPLVLTGRTQHITQFEAKLSGIVNNVFALKGGLGRKQRKAISEALTRVPEGEQRVILATGSYIGEDCDDARLTHCFSPCRSRGKERCSNTSAVFTASTTASGSSRSMTTSIRT